MSVEPTRIASAPASSAAAPCARDSIPLSAITTRSRGAPATSSSCARRSMRNEDRSRALIPITGAPSATARSSSCASCASTSVSRPRRAATPNSSRTAASSRSRRSSSTASAPASRAVTRCSSVEKKPFARSGTADDERAARRSSHVPPKRSSTRIDTAAAPALSYAAASARRVGLGSQVAGGRRAPLDLGDRREARAREAPLRIGPSAGFSRERDEPLQPLGRSAAIDRLRGALEPLAQIVRVPGCRDRRRGVEHDGVPLGARRALEDLPRGRGVLGRRAAGELGGIARGRSRARRDRGSARELRRRPPRDTRFGPAGESSSIPFAPCTTKARVDPRTASASATVRAVSGA